MKIYADKGFLPEDLPHCEMLYPFWGVDSRFGAGEIFSHVFEPYLNRGKGIFELAPLTEADIAVLPFQWEQVVPELIRHRPGLVYHGKEFEVARRGVLRALASAEALADEAAAAGKPLVVFLVGDDEATAAPLRGGFTFCTSLHASRRGPRQFALPIWLSEDRTRRSFGGEVKLRRKSAKPVVSFCGQVPPPPDPDWRTRLGRRLAALPLVGAGVELASAERLVHSSFAVRARALANLERDPSVVSSFVRRDEWFDGAYREGRFDFSVGRRARREYFENMLGSDYVLCTRGYGNCSIRFYETLSCGRIPVFVNTDCVLPYDWLVDWRRYTVWVEQDELASVGERVAEFHERLTDADFEELQRECRRAWERWLSPHGFFENFHRHFDGRGARG